MTKNDEFPEELGLVTDKPMEDQTKGINKAQQKLAPLFSLSKEEREKYLSELQEPQLSELQESLNVVSGYVEELLGEEDTLKKELKQRLEKEGWQDISVTIDTEQGPDLKAHKRKEDRTIFMEVKGKPRSSAKVNDALGEILYRMRIQSSDVRYCIAFPDAYLPLVKHRLPALVREKLGLYILFLKDGSVKALCPALTHEIDLETFDELFER